MVLLVRLAGRIGYLKKIKEKRFGRFYPLKPRRKS